MSMSTPIQNLPPATAASAPPALPDDPEILNVLEEMEKEVAAATARAAAATAPAAAAVAPAAMPMPPAAAALPPAPSPSPSPIFSPSCLHPGDAACFHGGSGAGFSLPDAKSAVIAAALALVLFYPESFATVYNKIPKFGGILEQNDKFIRAILLAVLCYFVFIRFRANI